MNDIGQRNQLNEVERQIGFSLPASYRALLNSIQTQSKKPPLLIYPIEKLVSHNKANQMQEFAPGAFLVGSDGGGEGLVLDVREESPTYGQFYFMPFIPMGWKDAILAGTMLDDIVKTYTERWG